MAGFAWMILAKEKKSQNEKSRVVRPVKQGSLFVRGLNIPLQVF